MVVPLISLMETDGNFPEMYDVEAARKRVREGEWVEVPFEVSTSGRVRHHGQIMKGEKRGARVRVRMNGKNVDAGALLARVTLGVYTKPSKFELWLPVSDYVLSSM